MRWEGPISGICKDPWSITEQDQVRLVNILKYGNELVAVIDVNDVPGCWYRIKDLVREEGDKVILSPLALELINQYKAMSGEWLELDFYMEFQFNAYGEFFNALLQGLPSAKEWFRRRVIEEFEKQLQKYGIANYYIACNDVALEYDIYGIIFGYNPMVTVKAYVTVYFDLPALPWYVWAAIVIGVIAAIAGVSYTIIRVEEEMTKQSYYNAMEAFYEMWKAYYEHPGSGQPPSTQPPGEQPPGQVPTPPSETPVPPGQLPVGGGDIGAIIVPLAGLAIIIYLITKKK